MVGELFFSVSQRPQHFFVCPFFLGSGALKNTFLGSFSRSRGQVGPRSSKEWFPVPIYLHKLTPFGDIWGICPSTQGVFLGSVFDDTPETTFRPKTGPKGTKMMQQVRQKGLKSTLKTTSDVSPGHLTPVFQTKEPPSWNPIIYYINSMSAVDRFRILSHSTTAIIEKCRCWWYFCQLFLRLVLKWFLKGVRYDFFWFQGPFEAPNRRL